MRFQRGFRIRLGSMLSWLRGKRGITAVGLWLITSTQATASPPQKTKPQPVMDATQATEATLPPFRYEGPLGPALTLLRQGKPQQAKGLLEKLRATTKDAKLRDDLESLLAESLMRQGQLPEAIRSLEAQVQKDPMALASRMTLGEAYKLTGQRDKERAIWNGFFDDHDAEKLDMKDCRTVRLLGQAAYYLGSYQDSYEQLNSAMELAKEQKRIDELVLSALALSELRIEKYEVGYAEVSVKEALRRDPQNPDAKALFARIKLEQGNDVSAATELIDEALAIHPQHPLASQLRAEILIDNEQYEEALSVVEPQLAKNGYDLAARALRAGALWLLDRRKDFEEEKAETLRRSPLYSQFYRIIAERLQVQHRYEDQVVLLEEAVQKNPKDFYALGDLGRAYAQLGDDERSHQTLLKAWKGDRYNRRTFNLLDLYEKHHQKTYKVITADIDPNKPGKGGLRLRVHKEEEALLVPLLVPLVQAEWIEFSRRYGFAPKLPISLELYKEPDNFSVRTFGLPSADPGMLGVTFSRVVTGRSPGQGKLPWGLMIWHELGHVFALELSKGRVPRWFTEGLSEWETEQLHPSWSRRTHAEVAAALRDGKLLSLADLNVGFTRARSQSHVVVAYHQAALSIGYLARRYGFAKIVQALRMFGDGKRTKEVLETISGISIEKLDEAFRADLRKQLAPYEGTFFVRPTDYADSEGLKLQIRNAPQTAKLHGLLAVAMIRSGGDPAEVAGEVAVARKLDPRCKEAILADAELHQKLGKKAEAEKLFQELISVGGDGFDARQRLGDLYAAQKKIPEAIKEYERAKLLDPDRSEPYERLAAIYEQEKRDDDALRELGRAAELDFSDDKILMDLVEKYAEKKRGKEVIKYGDLALYLIPYREKLRTLMAEAWLGIGQPGRAKAHLQASQKLLPEVSEVEEEDVPKLQAARKRIDALQSQANQMKAQPFSGPETLLDVARKRAGLPLP